MRKFIAGIAVVGATLTFVGTAHAGTCYANEKGGIIAHNVSCSTASRVLVRASDRMSNEMTLTPNVRVGGHYWLCRAKFKGQHQVTMACAYDGSHTIGALVRF
jgi:hypothetical protein